MYSGILTFVDNSEGAEDINTGLIVMVSIAVPAKVSQYVSGTVGTYPVAEIHTLAFPSVECASRDTKIGMSSYLPDPVEGQPRSRQNLPAGGREFPKF